MAGLTDEEKELIKQLRLLTAEYENAERPDCGGCTLCGGAEEMGGQAYTDEELLTILNAYGGNLVKAAYAILLRKAEASGIRFPSGLELPDEAGYYLRLARHIRGNATRAVRRADNT